VGLSAIVLAAGEGTRMRSTRPKPLHRLCGRAMVRHVLGALGECGLDRGVVVIGHGGDRVVKELQEDPPPFTLEFVEQRVQRGTGDAASVGLTGLPDDTEDDGGSVLVLPGDTPLLRPETVARLVAEHELSGAAATLLTARFDDPTGYGRVIRNADGRVVRIVEQADADADEAAVDEINTGIFCFRRNLLAPALRRVLPDNAQGEYYLTDVVEVLVGAGHPVMAVVADDPAETVGVNDRVQLADAEAELRRRANDAWMRTGVTMIDPATTYVDVTVELAPDVTLFPAVILRGRTRVGAGVEIGAASVLTDAIVGDDARIGPFAVLGPGAEIPAGAVTGPFYTAGSGTPGD
jgi:bifunctional UDP-N-acetylglucosamine pyrophosphorylase/glucosamine-1-phosphate N-acetyltransferase